MTIPTIALSDNFATFRDNYNSLANSVGDLNSLQTTDKTSIVAAVNSVNDAVDSAVDAGFSAGAGAGLEYVSATSSLQIDSATIATIAYVDTASVATADAWTNGRTITLTGDVTGVSGSFNGSANLSFTTAIGSGVIVNADINASAAIADTKLATISTAGKVSNSATTATNANTASAIVARDASGNFSAGTITASLTGNVTGNVSGSSGSCTGNSATATTATTATNTTVANEASDTSCYISFVTAATGDLPQKTNANLTFNSSTGVLTATDMVATSDETLKENIIRIENALNIVDEINGVYFNFRDQPTSRKVGVIAQNIEKVLPEVVYNNGDYKTVSYGNIVGLLIEAIKELRREVQELKGGK